MKALVLDTDNRTANLQDVGQPTPGAREIIVEAKAVSLSPIDPLYVSHPLAASGRTIGSDFAGIVTSLGSSVPQSSNVSIGDRVSGSLQDACSANERPGAFAEFLNIDWDVVWKIPEDVTLEEAAGVSLVALTAPQGMWYRLGLKTLFVYDPEAVLKEHPEWAWTKAGVTSEPDTLNFFIYDASTSVGLYAAKMVRLSAVASGKRIRLFAAASKARWVMPKSEPYAYEQLVDYHEPDWSEQFETFLMELACTSLMTVFRRIAQWNSYLQRSPRAVEVQSFDLAPEGLGRLGAFHMNRYMELFGRD